MGRWRLGAGWTATLRPCAYNSWCATRNRSIRRKKRKPFPSALDGEVTSFANNAHRAVLLGFLPSPWLGRGPPQVSAGATTRVDGGASRFPIADPVSGPSARWVCVSASEGPCRKLREGNSCPCPRRLQTQIIGNYLSGRLARFLCVCYIQLIWMLVPS